MANPHPTPKPENLHPPWPPGTSGNPAGYSRGRRISDAIERLIEEMALDREFGATAIAMALGKKYMLKRKVKDPETGEEIWFEHKSDMGPCMGPCGTLRSDRFTIFFGASGSMGLDCQSSRHHSSQSAKSVRGNNKIEVESRC